MFIRSTINVIRAHSDYIRSITVITLLATIPLASHATPMDMGKFKITSRDGTTGTASGTYITEAGATGTFTLSRDNAVTRGYAGVNFAPAANNTEGTNGIEIQNTDNISVGNDRDKFKYTFVITPTDNTSVHTIKIGQASYTQTGNSEIARHTLSHTSNPNISIPSQAIIKSNTSVPYYYNAMGDYFMGSRVSSTQLNSQNSTSSSQLRTDSSNGGESGLYYYNIPSLTGASGNQNPYTPTLNNANQVSLNSPTGVLPANPTFANILKSTSTTPNNQNTYSALSQSTPITNGGTYVSYAIENAQSNYVVAVKNANTITLTYEGIMNGNNGVPRAVVGETFNEWISFGVESEPLYVFSGTVFNDNGGINDANANGSTIGGIYNNNNFFNGIFNPAPSSPAEQGIAGSIVRLVDNCTAPTIEYARQTLVPSDAGKYQFTVLPTAISGSKQPSCILETRPTTNPDFPIRTTSDQRPITFSSSIYSYVNNDFGRVISKNAALILDKEQALNNCTITSLTISTTNNVVNYTKDSLSNVNPGQCIAYKITATNRANLGISNFTIQDTLQNAGTNGAMVTSKLTTPTYNSSNYATDSVPIGANGIVKTKPITLAVKGSYSFYFNTKYGTTQSN